MFATNRQKAVAAGLLCGAYHFGTGADGVAQAEFFLNTVQRTDTDLLVLDFEENTAGATPLLRRAGVASNLRPVSSTNRRRTCKPVFPRHTRLRSVSRC
jgi:GH25 family lysozyme M1 (1,4-beta-N-acetylmuramidase)